MTSSPADVAEPRASSVTITDDAISVDLFDGRTIMVPLAWYPRLWHGTQAERRNFRLLADGEYIHWPDLDEDLTITGFLSGQRSKETATSLKKWLDSRKSERK